MESLKRKVVSIILIMSVTITLMGITSQVNAADTIQTVSSLSSAKYSVMDRAPRITFNRTQKDKLVVYITDNGKPVDIKVYRVVENEEKQIKISTKAVEFKNATDGRKLEIDLTKKQMYGTDNPKDGAYAKLKIVARDSSKSSTDASANNAIEASYIVKNSTVNHEKDGKKYTTYFGINMAPRWALEKVDAKKDESLSNYNMKLIDNNSIDSLIVLDRNNNNKVSYSKAFYTDKNNVSVPLKDVLSNLKIKNGKYFRVTLIITSQGTVRTEDTTFKLSDVKVKNDTTTDDSKNNTTNTTTDDSKNNTTNTTTDDSKNNTTNTTTDDKKNDTTTDDKKNDTTTDDKKNDTTTDDKKNDTTKDDKKNDTTKDDKKNDTTTDDKKDDNKTEETKKAEIKLSMDNGSNALVYGDSVTTKIEYTNVDEDKQKVNFTAISKATNQAVPAGEITFNDNGFVIGKAEKEDTIIITASLQSDDTVKSQAEITVKPVEMAMDNMQVNYGDEIALADKVKLTNINEDILKNKVQYEFKTEKDSTGISISDGKLQCKKVAASGKVTATAIDSESKVALASKTIEVKANEIKLTTKYTGKTLEYLSKIDLDKTISKDLTNVNEDIKPQVKYIYELPSSADQKIARFPDDNNKSIVSIYKGVSNTTSIKINVTAKNGNTELAKSSVKVGVVPVYQFSMDRAPRANVVSTSSNIITIEVKDLGKNISTSLQRDYGTVNGSRKYKTLTSKECEEYGITIANNKDAKADTVTIKIDAKKYYATYKKHYSEKGYYSTNTKPDSNDKTMRIRVIALDKGNLKSTNVVKFKMKSSSTIEHVVGTPKITYNKVTRDPNKFTITMSTGIGTTESLVQQLSNSGKMGISTVTDLIADKVLIDNSKATKLPQQVEFDATKAKAKNGKLKLKIYATNSSTAKVEEIVVDSKAKLYGVDEKVTAVLEEVKE